MQSKLFGTMPDGTQVHAFTLRSSAGLTATITQYGGRIAALSVPMPEGPRNVTLGFDRLEPYLSDVAHLGAITGRYANRISNGRFTLDGRDYTLPINSAGNTLHGGPGGFAYKVWQAEPDGETLRLTLHSPDGDQGFPGGLDAVVEYRLDGDALVIDYAATSDAPTVLNLTNHAYFNLAGTGTILGHALQIPSTRVTPLSEAFVPNGEIRDIAGTAFDFSTPTPFGTRIDQDDPQLRLSKGYDICYVLADAPRAALVLAATVTASGIVMHTLTTEPGVQLYTGNHLGGAFPRFGGFCLETQHFADSPNRPNFPSTVLRPGQRFASRTTYRFCAE